jgi:hypothetical protein
MPTMFSGRLAPSAIAVIGSDDVFDANTVSGPVLASASLTIERFRSRSSNTASITRSVDPNPSHVVDPVTLLRI